MKCSQRKLISPYVDNELKTNGKTRFEDHLQVCRECSGRLEQLRKTSAFFKQAKQFQAPYGFSTRVMARAAERAREQQRSVLFPMFVRFSEIAIVLGVIFIGIVSGRFLMSPLTNQPMGTISSSFSLDVFEPAPPGSMGGVYLAMTEANNEK